MLNDQKNVEDFRGRSETILLVDDEQVLIELVEAILSLNGYKVIVARDGLQALDKYKEYQSEIALVLSDVGMPNMNGLDLLMMLKKLNPSVRVIIGSGFFDENVRSDLLRAGAMGFIEKPYSTSLLLQLIRKTLDSPPH